MVRRESELSKPGAIERERQKDNDPQLGDVIDRYVNESKREIRRTKAQVLRTIKKYDIADLRCSAITSADLVTFAQSLPVSPQTVQNYLSHLGAIFTLAEPAWGYRLDRTAMDKAFIAAKNLGLIAKGRERDRRQASQTTVAGQALSVIATCGRLATNTRTGNRGPPFERSRWRWS
jgi:hypothetical protein